MASMMNKTNMTVTLPDGSTQTGMHVTVRANIATCAALGHEGISREGVTGVRNVESGKVEIHFIDGDVWRATYEPGEIHRKRCGSCGQ